MSDRGNTRTLMWVAPCAIALCISGGDRAAAGGWTGRADMAGRWHLHTPGGSYCVMSFSGSYDSDHGAIAAMGFCPRMFIARPRWRFDAGRVVISARHGDRLAELAVVGRGNLRGQTAAGEALSLTR